MFCGEYCLGSHLCHLWFLQLDIDALTSDGASNTSDAQIHILVLKIKKEELHSIDNHQLHTCLVMNNVVRSQRLHFCLSILCLCKAPR